MSQYATHVHVRSSQFRRNRNMIAHEAKAGLGPIANTMILILIVATLGLLYLTQITKTSALNYQLQDLETQKTELQQKNQSLKVEAARLESLDRIKNSEVAKNLEPASNVSFIE